MMAGNQSVNAPAGIADQPNSCREARPEQTKVFGPPAKRLSLKKKRRKRNKVLTQCTLLKGANATLTNVVKTS